MLIGVKSTAIRLGDYTKPCMAAFTVIMMGGLTGSGLLCDMMWPYYMAVGITGARLGQQVCYLDTPAISRAQNFNFLILCLAFVI